MIRIVIVDDHAVVRQGLRFLLEQQEEMQVVGEGENGEQAIQLVTDLLPDVLLLDLLMPRLDGVTAVREIKRIAPTTRIIVLTSYFEDDQIFGVIKAGALSYLLKDMRPRELVAAIEAAARGESVLHPMVAARVLREMQSQQQSPLNDLTPRELEVQTHVSNILSKLHLADRTQAAIYALQKRLVHLDEALEQEK
jgi:two-component system, NarL family, response regulator LiaR